MNKKYRTGPKMTIVDLKNDKRLYDVISKAFSSFGIPKLYHGLKKYQKQAGYKWNGKRWVKVMV